MDNCCGDMASSSCSLRLVYQCMSQTWGQRLVRQDKKVDHYGVCKVVFPRNIFGYLGVMEGHQSGFTWSEASPKLKMLLGLALQVTP